MVCAELGEEVLGVLEQRPLAFAQLLDGLAAAPPEVGDDGGWSGGRGLGVAHHEPPMKRSRIVAQCRQSAFGCTFAPVLDPDLVPTPLDDARDSRLVEVTPPAAPPRFRRLDLVRRFTGFALWVGWRRLRGGPSTIELAVAVRTLFESLGGLWIKLGQLVAMRRDLLPGDFCNELGRLQDRVTGFPGAVARAVVEADLGRTVDSLFSEFEDHPFAAASIGQLHRARVRGSGRRLISDVLNARRTRPQPPVHAHRCRWRIQKHVHIPVA